MVAVRLMKRETPVKRPAELPRSDKGQRDGETILVLGFIVEVELTGHTGGGGGGLDEISPRIFTSHTDQA
jgi:hypothetical protein